MLNNLVDIISMMDKKSRNQKIINQYKRYGIFGNEIVFRVFKKINLRDSPNCIYKCYIITSTENFNPIINPVTKEEWEISFVTKNDYNEGDILQANYIKQEQEEFMNQIIKIKIPDIKKLESSSTIDLKYGKYFADIFREQFDGEVFISLAYEVYSESFENELEEMNRKNELIRNQISEYKKSIQELEKLKAELNSDIVVINKNKEQLLETYNMLKVKLGFEERVDGEESEEDEEYFIANIKNIYENIQSCLYHYDNEKLIYGIPVIRRFLTALRTNQLVLLSGPSGTGKSSLVNQLGNIIKDIKVHHVAVQSNWMDCQDLLGVFNPIRKNYIPTPFLEALINAHEDEKMGKKNLHIICLDEMNLSHIEYYFSPFLSIKEKKESEQYLDLYAQRFYNQARYDLINFFNKPLDEITVEDIDRIEPIKREELQDKYDLCFRYPAKFYIPQNIRFVGTLNMDGSVKPLSPKVIDRSFIIELNHFTDYDLEKKIMKKVIDKKIDINIEEFMKKNEMKLKKQEQTIIDSVIDCSDRVKSIPNARLNSRAIGQCEKYLKSLYASVDKEEILDDLIIMKLLPRIQFNINQDESMKNEFISLVEFINNLLNPILISGDARNKINEMNNKKRVVQFWG